MGEDTAVSIVIEKTRVNAWNLGGLLVVAIGQAFALGVVYTKIDARIAEGERYRVTRSTSTDKNFDELKAKVANLPNVEYRLVQAETTIAKNNEAMNARIDRIVESFGGKLDKLAEDVAAVRTDVRVLSGKVEPLIPQRTQLSLTPPELVR